MPRLGECVEIDARTSRPVEGGKVPVYATRNVQGWTDRSLAGVPTLTLARQGSCGIPLIIDPPFGLTGTRVMLRVRPGWYMPYIFAILDDDVDFARWEAGTSIKHLELDRMLRDLEVPNLPEYRQRKIGDTYLALCRAEEEEAAELERLKEFKRKMLDGFFPAGERGACPGAYPLEPLVPEEDGSPEPAAEDSLAGCPLFAGLEA